MVTNCRGVIITGLDSGLMIIIILYFDSILIIYFHSIAFENSLSSCHWRWTDYDDDSISRATDSICWIKQQLQTAQHNWTADWLRVEKVKYCTMTTTAFANPIQSKAILGLIPSPHTETMLLLLLLHLPKSQRNTLSLTGHRQLVDSLSPRPWVHPRFRMRWRRTAESSRRGGGSEKSSRFRNATLWSSRLGNCDSGSTGRICQRSGTQRESPRKSVERKRREEVKRTVGVVFLEMSRVELLAIHWVLLSPRILLSTSAYNEQDSGWVKARGGQKLWIVCQQYKGREKHSHITSSSVQLRLIDRRTDIMFYGQQMCYGRSRWGQVNFGIIKHWHFHQLLSSSTLSCSEKQDTWVEIEKLFSL